MTRTTRFPRLYSSLVTVLLSLLLLVSVNPAAQTFAEAQATPVVEAPAPAPVAPQVETPVAQPEDIDIPIPGKDEEAEVVASDPEVTETPTAWTIAPMAVVPGGTLIDCAPNHQSIAPNSRVVVGCLLSFTNPSQSSFKVTRPSLAASGGYMAEVRVYASQGGTFYGVLPMGTSNFDAHVSRYEASTFYVDITIQSGNQAPRFDYTFTACLTDPAHNCITNAQGSVRITLNQAPVVINLIEDKHYGFSCDQVYPGSVGLGATATSSCSVSALAGMDSGAIRLDEINWSLTGAGGWDVSLAGQKLSTPSGQFVPGTLPIISGQNPHLFNVSFTPTACAAQAVAPQVTLSVMVSPVGQAMSAVTSSDKIVSAPSAAPKQETSARLIAIPGTVEADYSMTIPQDLSADFTAEYTVSGCKTWTGYAEMSEFTPASDTEVLAVPVLESVTPGAPRIISGGIKDVQPADQNTTTTAPTTLITGDAPGQRVVVEQDINLKYTVPANTTVGTYESTVSVNITAAP